MRCYEMRVVGPVREWSFCPCFDPSLEHLFVSTCIPTLTSLYHRLVYPGHGLQENGSLHLLLSINGTVSNLGYHTGTVYARWKR